MTAAIAQVPRSTMREHAAQRIRAAVLSGALAPGSALVESELARRLGVSRGPLREAIRQLAEEGLLVNVPYTATRVIELKAADVCEIYSLRTVIETFAFELAWPRRDDAFRREIDRRHEALLAALRAGDGPAAIEAELALHGTAYEWSGHRLLQETWRSLSGRLHFYFAVHQRAHGRAGPRDDAHRDYVSLAKGEDLDAMRAEIADHMRRGVDRVASFLGGDG